MNNDQEQMIAPRVVYRGTFGDESSWATRRCETIEEVQSALDGGWRLTVLAKEEQATADLASAFDPHVANVDAVKAHLETVTDAAALDALAEREAAHPNFDGGRAGVLRAIDDRREVLNR